MNKKTNLLFSFLFLFIKLNPSSISYQILCHNETDCLDYLLKTLQKNIQDEDEIVIVDDNSDNPITLNILNNASIIKNTKIYKRALNYDFSAQRNYADSLCIKDYIFSIDADQVPSLYLMQNIKKILNSKADAYKIPILIIINGLSAFDHRVNDRSWINWPNYKIVIYKKKKSAWIKPVHESIPNNSFEQVETLPKHEKYSLIEIKTDIKTKGSNRFYFECYKNWLIKTLKKRNKKEFKIASNDIKRIYKHLILQILEDKEFIHYLEIKNKYNYLFYLLDQRVSNKNELSEYIDKAYLEIEKNKKNTTYEFEKLKNNCDSLDKNMNTLLIHAIYNNDAELLKKLLNKGADSLEKNTNGHIPLHHAMYLKNIELIDILMKPTLNSLLKKYGLCLLNDINSSTDDKNHTLLMHAAYRNHYDLAKLLLLNGANVLIRDNEGHMALDHAKYMNNTQVYELLLTKTIEALLSKENIEFRGVVTLPINNKNETMLTYCAINNKYLLAKLLIEYGAPKDVIDDYGKVPLDYANYFYKILKDDNYKKIYELLKS